MARNSSSSTAGPQGFQRPKTAQEAIVGELRARLVTGELQPGRPINQESLGEELGVSPIPIREALKMLEGQGLVNYIPHRGYFVRTLSSEDLHELFLMNRALETVALTEAIPRLGENDIEVLRAEAARADEAGMAMEIVAFTSANRRFHFALMEPAEMPRLLKIIGQLWDATDAYRSVYYGKHMDAWSSSHPRIRQEHEEIIKLAARHEVGRLLSLLDAHRSAAQREFERYLESDYDASSAAEESGSESTAKAAL